MSFHSYGEIRFGIQVRWITIYVSRMNYAHKEKFYCAYLLSFQSKFYTQCGARTHHHNAEIKNCMLYPRSWLGVPCLLNYTLSYTRTK